LPRLFTKFYQADTSRKRAGGGAGLGLYISKQIVECHGGSIGVESTEGEGSTFHFSLPRLRDHDAST
jgi:signal transduction histidine kinase